MLWAQGDLFRAKQKGNFSINQKSFYPIKDKENDVKTEFEPEQSEDNDDEKEDENDENSDGLKDRRNKLKPSPSHFISQTENNSDVIFVFISKYFLFYKNNFILKER